MQKMCTESFHKMYYLIISIFDEICIKISINLNSERTTKSNSQYNSESMRTVHSETKCERDKKLQCCKSHINVHYIVHYKVSGSLDVHQKEQGHTQLATWACKVTENGVLQRENVSVFGKL